MRKKATRESVIELRTPSALVGLLLKLSAFSVAINRKLRIAPAVASAKIASGMNVSNCKAASVVFFTRDARGNADSILLGLEHRAGQKLRNTMYWHRELASSEGIESSALKDVLVFPQGKRDPSDANSIDTAKREYIEETGDFGSLAKYLDLAVFQKVRMWKGRRPKRLPPGNRRWTKKKNLAVYWESGKMMVYFCEVPAAAAAASLGSSENVRSTATEPKATKQEAEYRAFWLDVEELRRVARSIEAQEPIRPTIVGGKSRYFHPISLLIVRKTPAVREMFGLDSTL